MALTQIDFDDDEEQIIDSVSKEFKLNKPKSVKKIINNYKLKGGKNGFWKKEKTRKR